MPGGTRSQLGNELFGQALYVPAVTYPTLAANASSDNTLTVKGVLSGDLISWNIQAPPQHLQIDNIYISAPDTLTIRWGTDATGISTGSVALLLEVTRPENGSLGITNLPNSLQ